MSFLQRATALGRHITRPITRKGWKHWLRFAALLAVGSWIGHVLSESNRFTAWRYWLYAKQVAFQRHGPVYPRHTALVLLDDEDYWSLDYQARSRYKRDKLAALLDRLNAAGVNTVAFDVFLDSPFPDKPAYDFPDYVAEDAIFFDAIRRMCAAGRHVVLATEYFGQEPGQATVPPLKQAPSLYEPLLPSLPCVSSGHIDVPDDLRKIPGIVTMADGHSIDSMSLAITKLSDPIAYEMLVSDADRGFRFGRYLSPEDFRTRNGHQFIFNGRQIQTMELNQLRQALADRIVIVGGHYHSGAYMTGEFIDMFNSPSGIEPGAMLHANYVEAMRDPNSTFTPISDHVAEVIEWTLALILAFISALEVHVGWKWLGFVTSFVASMVLTYVLLQNLGLFLDFFIPIVMIVAHTMVEEILDTRHELKHTRHLLHFHTHAAQEKTP